MHKLRSEAEELRSQGYSYTLINQKLGISKSTMHYWFKDRPFVPNSEVVERMKSGPTKAGIDRHNERVRSIRLIRSAAAKEIGVLTKRDVWMLGLGLYVGEGSKSIESIRIINSDPAVVRMSIRWLKEICGLDDSNLRITLHVYPDTDIKKCHSYWQEITNLPETSFYKDTIDKRRNKNNNKKGKLPYGTVHLRVVSDGDPSKGVKLFRKIEGWTIGAINQV